MKDERKTKKQLIEELEGLRASSEQQRRELQVEECLDRVRRLVLAMQGSDDLKGVSEAVLGCFSELGLNLLRSAVVADGMDWVTFAETGGAVPLTRPTPDWEPGPVIAWEAEYQREARARGEPWCTWTVAGERLRARHREGSAVVPGEVPDYKHTLEVHYRVFMERGTLTLVSLEELTGDQLDIASRFSRLFDYAYERFLELKEREDRNHELEVEQALERVRTQVAAMQESADLFKVAEVVKEQLQGLGVSEGMGGINIMDEASQTMRLFAGGMSGAEVTLPHTPGAEAFWQNWREGKTQSRHWSREAFAEFWLRMVDEGAMREDEARRWIESTPPDGRWSVDSPFAHGTLAMTRLGAEPFSDDDIALLERFTEVFALGYTRYLDLQAAEERAARSAREAAYERVRSAVLASRSAEDILQVASLMQKELQGLGVRLSDSGINLIDEGAGSWRAFAFLREDAIGEAVGLDAPRVAEVVAHWRRGDVFMRAAEEEGYNLERARDIGGESLVEHFESIRVVVDVPFTYGTLAMNSAEVDQFSEEDIAILQGFADVISLAYARYLDFEKLEAQNRELEMEQILERVRGRALGMHRSEDLTGVAAAVFRELRALDLTVWRCGFGIFHEQIEPPELELWYTTAEGDARPTPVGTYGMDEDASTVIRGLYLAWKRGEEHYCTDRSGDELKAIIAHLTEDRGLSLPEWRERQPEGLPERLWFDYFYFPQGFLQTSLLEPLPGEMLHVLKQLAAIFGVAYSRFLELQQAEENARQAEERARQVAREAAYERVRSAVLAARGTEDILGVNSLMERELRELGVHLAACSINLIDEDAGAWRQFWRGAETISLDSPVVAEAVARQRRGEVYMRPPEADLAELERFQSVRVVIDVPFTYGTLAMNSTEAEEFSEEEIAILQGFADVISLAYTRYLDFEKVEQQNKALAEANRRIKEETQQKSDFLSRMSHDLRTPMNAIIGYTRILLRRAKDALEDRQYRNLENIQTSADNLLRLINEILDLSRIEAGRIELRPEPVDVGQLVGECVTSVAPLARPGVELVQELGDVPKVTTDGDRTRRVVMNLLGNAVKFTEAGSITVSLNSVDSGVELAVADTGVGIPAEDLPHIFEEFRQVERQVGDKTEGTGLGLAIAARSVEMLGGTISAESEVGVGTTFTLRIGDYRRASEGLERGP